MDQPTGTYGITKAEIDAAPLGAMTISFHHSARCDQPAAIADALSRLLQRIPNERRLILNPLRLILVTANLGEAVDYWNRQLGLPESGVSNQPEGIAAGKHMSWGNDHESARSIIILPDYIAAAVSADTPVVIAGIAHELGHVHDDFLRGLMNGFPQPVPIFNNDWPGIRSNVAEMTWSEYAAESTAAPYMTREDIHEMIANDVIHLAGVHNRLRKLIDGQKLGQIDIPTLWGRAVTDISDLSDLFANLGRAAARLPFTENAEQARASLVDPAGEAANWKPVVDQLLHELTSLDPHYTDWGETPFEELGQVIALGFNTAGLFPVHDGQGLRVNVS